MSKFIVIFVLSLSLAQCKNDKPIKPKVPEMVLPAVKYKIPAFNKDSAYAFVDTQVKFGTRIPGSKGHTQCGDWIVAKAKSFGATVTEQKFPGETFNGLKFEGRNIIASYNPEIKVRIILSAHWDTRVVSDHDPDVAKRNQPVLGADDAGSGAGILLEIARQLHLTPINNLGVDLIFWDGEDQGGEGGDGTDWCLGSQYWAKNKHIENYQAKFGINLDMVGSHAPRYTKEGTSVSYAGSIMDKVWSLAQTMGYANYFVNQNSTAITDDHYFINTIAGIPMIDIINRPNGSSFMQCWHTTCDDMSGIDPETLRFTGQVVMAVVYRTANGEF